MKVLIFIEHDIMIRHFVHSGAFAELNRRHDVRYVLPEAGYKRIQMTVSEADLGAPLLRLPVHQTRLEYWKKLFLSDQLRWRPGRHFAALRKLRRDAVGPKAVAIYRVLTLPIVRQLCGWWWLKRLASLPYRDLDRLLTDEKPDVVLHPSVLEGVYINDLTDACRRYSIPFVVIMNSWDNPSTKQAMAGHPDKLLVWGEQTLRHAVEFTGMKPEDVVRFGAAQFEVYREPPRICRDEFCRLHNIDPAKRVLLYAGSSKETDEFHHLTQIEAAIEAGTLKEVTIVYRPHPWGGGGRGGERLLDHPWKHVRIEASMRDYLERVRAGDKSNVYPDYRHTHDVLSSVDAVVSPLSTILLEAAMHGKPVLCFLPEEEDAARHFQMVAPMIHFEDMYRMPQFLKARRLDQLVESVGLLLSNVGNAEYTKELETACTYFVKPFERPFPNRIADFVEGLAQGTNRRAV